MAKFRQDLIDDLCRIMRQDTKSLTEDQLKVLCVDQGKKVKDLEDVKTKDDLHKLFVDKWENDFRRCVEGKDKKDIVVPASLKKIGEMSTAPKHLDYRSKITEYNKEKQKLKK